MNVGASAGRIVSLRLGSEVLLAVLALSVLARAAVYVALPLRDHSSAPFHVVLYHQALSEHFLEYVAFTTLKPPLTYALHALVVAVAGGELVWERRLFLLLVFLLDVVSVALIYGTARQLGAPRTWSGLAAAIYSLALIPFEVWRDGAHHDHLTTVFASFVVYAGARFLRVRTVSAVLWLAVAGALLAAQFPPAAYTMPLAGIAAAAIALRTGTRARAAIAAGAIAVAGPLLATAIVVAKNEVNAQVRAPSNLGGPSLMVFAQEATKDDPAVLVRTLDRAAVPGWYRWCFENGVLPPDVPERLSGWSVLVRAYGICYRWNEPTDPAWPSDFEPLLGTLSQLGADRQREIVERDARDARERPYLFAGLSPELSARWIGLYGEVSTRVALTFLLSEPVRYARMAAITQARYVVYGPFFPRRTLFVESAGGAQTTQAAAVPGHAFLVGAATAHGLVAAWTYLALPVMTVILVFRGRRSPSSAYIPGLVWLLVLIASSSAVYSLSAAWEIDRYFMQVTPYLAVATALLGDVVAKEAVSRARSRSL